MRVLGIETRSDLLKQWRSWFAPAVQPFRVTDMPEPPLGHRLAPSAEVRDTFHMYGGSWVWLDRAQFTALRPGLRRTLLSGREATGRVRDLTADQRRHAIAGGTRFAWWPPLMERVGDRPILDYVTAGVPPSRHLEVPARVWQVAKRLLPDASRLAGTFASGSGPNCFGTVMAAAAVTGADTAWVFPEPFERWLAAHTNVITGTDNDESAGIVLVWRDRNGLAAHAAVTIGGGYALNKPSQAWCSPRLVWTVRETINASRFTGLTLSRHRLIGTTMPTDIDTYTAPGFGGKKYHRRPAQRVDHIRALSHPR